MFNITNFPSSSTPFPHDFACFSPDKKFFKYNAINDEQIGGLKSYAGRNKQDDSDVLWSEMKSDAFPEEKIKKMFKIVTALKGLENSSITKIYDCWEEDNGNGIITTFITEPTTSGSLADYLKRFKSINTTVIKSWCRQILEGLNFLHSQNPQVVHGNLNCTNIFITGTSGKAKIYVLGFLASANKQLEFMAPEIASEKEYDEKVDIYAFGMCFLQMVTSEIPYAECQQSTVDIFNKIAKGIKPECFNRIPKEYPKVAEIIEKCISAKIEDRPSAKELLENEFFLQVSCSTSMAQSENGIVETMLSAKESKASAEATFPSKAMNYAEVAETLKRRPDIAYPSTATEAKTPQQSEEWSTLRLPYGKSAANKARIAELEKQRPQLASNVRKPTIATPPNYDGKKFDELLEAQRTQLAYYNATVASNEAKLAEMFKENPNLANLLKTNTSSTTTVPLAENRHTNVNPPQAETPSLLAYNPFRSGVNPFAQSPFLSSPLAPLDDMLKWNPFHPQQSPTTTTSCEAQSEKPAPQAIHPAPLSMAATSSKPQLSFSPVFYPPSAAASVASKSASKENNQKEASISTNPNCSICKNILLQIKSLPSNEELVCKGCKLSYSFIDGNIVIKKEESPSQDYFFYRNLYCSKCKANMHGNDGSDSGGELLCKSCLPKKRSRSREPVILPVRKPPMPTNMLPPPLFQPYKNSIQTCCPLCNAMFLRQNENDENLCPVCSKFYYSHKNPSTTAKNCVLKATDKKQTNIYQFQQQPQQKNGKKLCCALCEKLFWYRNDGELLCIKCLNFCNKNVTQKPAAMCQNQISKVDQNILSKSDVKSSNEKVDKENTSKTTATLPLYQFMQQQKPDDHQSTAEQIRLLKNQQQLAAHQQLLKENEITAAAAEKIRIATYGTSNAKTRLNGICGVDKKATVQSSYKVVAENNETIDDPLKPQQLEVPPPDAAPEKQIIHSDAEKVPSTVSSPSGTNLTDASKKCNESDKICSNGKPMPEDCPKFAESNSTAMDQLVAIAEMHQQIWQQHAQQVEAQKQLMKEHKNALEAALKCTITKKSTEPNAFSTNEETTKTEDTFSTCSSTSSTTLSDAFTSQKYADVMFLTNDAKKVFAHRCILFSFSDIFTALFDQKPEIPSEIEVDFPQNVVIRALQFCYGNPNGIKDSEKELIKFSESFEIKGLKEACIKSLEEKNPTIDNICDYVVTAFDYDIEPLKEKCLKFIGKFKNEIGGEKLSKLPVDILVLTVLSM